MHHGQTIQTNMNKTIKFLQINKGNSELSQKTDQIMDLLQLHKPHIVVINELNAKRTDTISRHQFQDYIMESDNLDISDQISRTGILVHKDLQYKRRRDLETVGTSTIWLQLHHPGRKPLMVQGIYRQFQRLGKVGSILPAAQRARWSQIIDKWERATEEGNEIITIGDINLNYLRWEVEPKEMNNYDILKKPMIDLLKFKILSKGHVVLSKFQQK